MSLMKSVFLSLSIILLINQIAVAVDDSYPSITYENLTEDKITQWIASDGREESEESYYMRLIDLIRHFPGTEKDKQYAFMAAISNIHLEAVSPAYRTIMMMSARQICNAALIFIERRLTHIPEIALKDEKRYRPDRMTEELWFDSETKKDKESKRRKYVKFWRGYKFNYEIKLNKNGLLSIFIRPSGPILYTTPRLAWGLRLGKQIIKPLSETNYGGYTFTKIETLKYLGKLEKGKKFQIEWGYMVGN